MSKTSHTTRDNRSILCYRVGNRTFGIDASNASVILGSQALTTLPQCPKHIAGIFGYHGRAIALVDLVTFLQLERSVEDRDPNQVTLNDRTIVVNASGMTAGFPVEMVNGIFEINSEDLKHPCFSDEGRLSEFVKNEFFLNDKLVNVLDADRLLNSAKI